MPKLIAFGEILIDWIPLEKKQEGQLSLPIYGQYPGGAPCNVAVAAAQLGAEAHFLGKTGEDAFGSFLRHSLDDFGVKTDYLLEDPAPTPMAFVSLDDDGERSFSFHRTNSADLQYKATDYPEELFNGEGIFHICSNTLTDTNIRQTTWDGLALAEKKGFLKSFDVNIRFPLWNNLDELRPAVLHTIEQSDLIKLSKEELEYLANGQNEEEFIQDYLDKGVSLFLISDGPKPMKLYSKVLKKSYQPPKVQAVDTTGGGDAFIGGWIYSFLQKGLCSRDAVTKASADDLDESAQYAMQCGAFAVSKRGAWTALPKHDDIQL